VTVPPLLADLARHVLTSRADLTIIAEIGDSEIAVNRLRDLAPDVVIIGQAAHAAEIIETGLVRSMFPHARVLTLSADLTQLFGPGEDDVNEFTIETLTDCLRR
jgi:DNA-binding NarL/FixJ family response regulator